MNAEPERLIDIDELARQAGRRLEELGVAQVNGQVTARPDIRTLRWYTTVGLLDRPVERRGRRAFYSSRHVAQVVAVKRLQAEGVGLTDIAIQLAGRSTAALVAIAHDPAALPEGAVTGGAAIDGAATGGPATDGAATGGPATDGPATVTGDPGTGRVASPATERTHGAESSAWSVSPAPAAYRPGARPPAPAPVGATTAATAATAAGGTADFWSAAPLSRSVGVPGVLAGIALDHSTTVTFAAPRPLTDADVESLRRAATPLLDELRRRGLVPVPVHLTDLPKDRLP